MGLPIPRQQQRRGTGIPGRPLRHKETIHYGPRPNLHPFRDTCVSSVDMVNNRRYIGSNREYVIKI